MTRTFCDICGKEIYPGLTKPLYEVSVSAVGGSLSKEEGVYVHEEVCSGCAKAIESHIKEMARSISTKFR